MGSHQRIAARNLAISGGVRQVEANLGLPKLIVGSERSPATHGFPLSSLAEQFIRDLGQRLDLITFTLKSGERFTLQCAR